MACRSVGAIVCCFTGAIGVALLVPLSLAADGATRLPTTEELAAIFQPLRHSQATLSRDGQFIAYVLTEPTTASEITGEYHQSVVIQRVDDAEPPWVLDGGEWTALQGWAAMNHLIYTARRTDVTVRFPAPHFGENDAMWRHDAARSLDATVAGRPMVTPGARSAEIYSADATAKKSLLLAHTDENGGEPHVSARPFADDAKVILRSSEGDLRFAEIDLATGHRRVAARRDAPTGIVLADRHGLPRVMLRVAEPPSTVQQVLYSSNGGRTWSRDARLERVVRFETELRDHFGPRELPVAIDGDDDTLYYASNLHRDMLGLYAVSLRSKQQTAFRLECPDGDLVDPLTAFPSPTLVWDRLTGHVVGARGGGVAGRTCWADPQLAQVQQQVEREFPSKHVDIIDWDDKRQRFLLLMTAASDAGRYYVFDRTADRYTQVLKREPSLDPDDVNATSWFAIPTAEGSQLTGYITRPRHPISSTPPLLIALHDGPGMRYQPGYDADAQALAAMGFLVVRLNYTGSAGFGLRHRRAIQAGFDRIPTEDVMKVIAWIATSEPTAQRRKVVLFGTGFGGYIALRAMQTHPEAFCCAVVVNPILDVARAAAELSWQGPSGGGSSARTRLEAAQAEFLGAANASTALPVMRQMDRITKPLMLVQAPDRNRLPAPRRAMGIEAPSGRFAVPAPHPLMTTLGEGGISEPMSDVADTRRLRDTILARGGAVAYREINHATFTRVAVVRARVFSEICDFFAEHVYAFVVNVGEPTVKEGP